MTLGEKLQRLRRARGLTQEQLAGQVKVSRQSLSGWENDTALPDTANVIALADLFGVTTDYLLREDTGTDAVAPGREVDPPQVDSADSVPPQAERVSPRNAAPRPLLVLGWMLLALGMLTWLGFQVAQRVHPVHLYSNGREYTGIQAFIRINQLEGLYYAGLALMVIGVFIVIFCYVLSWLFKCEQKKAE